MVASRGGQVKESVFRKCKKETKEVMIGGLTEYEEEEERAGSGQIMGLQEVAQDASESRAPVGSGES